MHITALPTYVHIHKTSIDIIVVGMGKHYLKKRGRSKIKEVREFSCFIWQFLKVDIDFALKTETKRNYPNRASVTSLSNM